MVWTDKKSDGIEDVVNKYEIKTQISSTTNYIRKFFFMDQGISRRLNPPIFCRLHVPLTKPDQIYEQFTQSSLT